MTTEELVETAKCCDLKTCDDCPSKGRICCQERAMLELADIVRRLQAEIVALRAQQEAEKNNSLTLGGCKYCADPDGVSPLDWMYGLDHIFPDYRFCPMCGRELSLKLEEEKHGAEK